MSAEVLHLESEREARSATAVAPDGFEDVPAIMSAAQLAVVLDVKPRTLQDWRDRREGPAFQNPTGTRIYRYYRRDVLAWLENKKPVAVTTGQNI